MKSYWDLLAGQFEFQQPPLRPCVEDIRAIEKKISDWNRQRSVPDIRALLFGVTPEIAGLDWPANTFLTAIEKSRSMIEIVWPGNVPGRREAIGADWFQVEMPAQAFDLVLGDGFMTGLRYPDQYEHIAGRISRWLKPGGLFLARLFVRPQKKETLAEIRLDLKANRIAKFDILKWRLAMAIQPDTRTGVVVDDIYRAWKDIEKEMPDLPEQSGWPRQTVNTIEFYAGREGRYFFPTIEELNAVFASCLEPVSITVPDYDFGPCCPLLVYRRRD